MTDKISNCTDLETAAKQFQDAIVFAYNEICPLTVKKTTGIYPGGMKTSRREGRKFVDYSLSQRSQ